MTERPSILHPHDPANAPFDFLAWRVTRRFVADRLRVLADVRPEALRLAGAIEAESVSESDLAELETLLAAEGEVPVRSNDELFLALDRIIERLGLRAGTFWHLPAIRPDWSAIPVSRAAFAGEVDGVRLAARLEADAQPVPAYEIVWSDRNGSESEPQKVDASVGEFLSLAPAVWDWMLARRLSLLCAAGVMRWPTSAPLRIEDVSVPVRGF